jgi:Mrp family chromosome partitioning ATPase
VLAMIDWEGGEPDEQLLNQAIKEVMVAGPGKRKQGVLHLVTSGTKAKDPGRLIAGHGMEAFLAFVRELDYAYVIIDAPPLLGIADSQVLARQVDHTILVHRLDRLTADNVADLRQLLDGMETTPLGIVVIGARAELSPYYLQHRPTIVQAGTERG